MSDAENRLDHLMTEAFKTNSQPMLDYVDLKFKLKQLQSDKAVLVEALEIAEGLIVQSELSDCSMYTERVAKFRELSKAVKDE